MAGVKGRSGGARPGSGPKPALLEADSDDAVEFLRQVMRERGASAALRVRAAIELARIEKGAVPGRAGKKAAQSSAAKNAASGKYSPGAPPKLVVDNS